jgi:hypothetical protein
MLLALALVSTSSALSAAGQVIQFTEPFSETVVCPTSDGYSEEIYLSGTYRALIKYVESGEHVSTFFQVFWEADGYGISTGAEYLLNGKWMEVTQESPPYIFIWNDHFRLIGKGQAENFDTYFKVKIVMNANGDPIIDYVDAMECESY